MATCEALPCLLHHLENGTGKGFGQIGHPAHLCAQDADCGLVPVSSLHLGWDTEAPLLRYSTAPNIWIACTVTHIYLSLRQFKSRLQEYCSLGEDCTQDMVLHLVLTGARLERLDVLLGAVTQEEEPRVSIR